MKAQELLKLHKDFHSTPDLQGFLLQHKLEQEVASCEEVEDNKTKSLSQDNLNKLNASSRHSWACISSAVQGVLDRNYENSWKSIEKMAASKKKSKHKDGTGEKGDESDASTASGSVSDVSEKDAPKASAKQPVLNESEYRTIKPLRPVQSKTLPRRASTGCSLGPTEQQTIINLVPPGQVIRVDVSKSKEYATLDHAAAGRREGGSVMSSFKPNDSAKLYESPHDLKSIGYREQGSENNSNTLKKIRSQSLPPSKQKPGAAGVDYAQPDNVNKDVMPDLINGSSRQDDSDAQTPTNASIRSSDSGSSTSQGTLEADSEDRKLNSDTLVSEPQRALQEAKEKLKPVLKVTSGSGEATKIRIEVKQSPRLQRKAEKTVTFQPEPPTQSHSSNVSQMPHSMSVDEIQKIKSSMKSSKSFPNDLGQEDGDGNSSSGVSSDGGQENSQQQHQNGAKYVTCLPVNPDSDSSEDSSDKTWILKDDNAPDGEIQDHGEKEKRQGENDLRRTNGQQRTVHSNELNTSHANRVTTNNSSHTVSYQNTDKFSKQVYQQSFPHHSVPDNSSNNNSSILTYGTISRSQQQAGRHPSGGALTKNAVSLVKLPPPLEIESETEEGKSPKETPVQKKSNLSSNPQMYHTLQPQRSRPLVIDQHQHYISRQMAAAAHSQSQGQPRQAEKSIEESLKLIQMHVQALKVINISEF